MRTNRYQIDLRDRSQLVLIAAAVAFAGLFLAGVVGFVLAGLGSYPSPLTAATDEVERYFRESRDAVRLNACLQLAAAVPLLAYGAIAGNRLRLMGDRSATPAIAAAAATLSAACLALAAIAQWALSRPPALAEGGALLRALQDVAFMAGGPAHVVSLGALVAAVSVAAWSARGLPGWIVALGAIVGVLSAASVLTLLFDAAAWLLPVARFPTFLWLLLTAIALPAATRQDGRRQLGQGWAGGPAVTTSRSRAGGGGTAVKGGA